MRKNLLSLAFITLSCGFATAQTKEELKKDFHSEMKKKNEYVQSLNQKSKSSSNFLNENIDVISNISADEIAILTSADIRSNSASNITELQSGAIAGISINGENMSIAIFDGGTVLATHGEFRDLANAGMSRIIDLENGAQQNSSHATNVAGFIAAEGRYTFFTIPGVAKGVLPKATVKHAGYSDTANGDRFSKIVEYGEYISNHSYGVNNGWSKETATSGSLGEGFYYPVNTTLMNNPNQTLAGAYQSNDQSIDKIVYADPKFTIVKSSGNYYGTGPSQTDNKYRWAGGGYVPFAEGEIVPTSNCSLGAYCIGNGSLAKNIIVVGAIDIPATDNNKVDSPSQIIRSSYSSVGPRKDGAIKPDLVAVGTSVIAPTISSTNPASISTSTRGNGTSYSAPIVTGAVGALTQLKRQLINDPGYYFFSDEIKALLIHTAIEAGNFEGPDNWYGWGLLDAKKSAELILALHNGENFMNRKMKISGIDDEEIFSSNGEELKVTISWIDPAADFMPSTLGRMDDISSKLVNDLDVRVFDTETNEEYLPWKLDLANVTGAAVKGDNTVDNVEQILIKNTVAGRKYKIIVSNKSDLINHEGKSSNQDYTLLVTGAKLESLNTDDNVVKSVTALYPTLAKDIVNIKTTEKIKKVDVIDLTGKLISTTKSDRINVSSLPVGVYIINITTDKGITTKKIVKQ